LNIERFYASLLKNHKSSFLVSFQIIKFEQKH
jgi:hypothetical protein